MIFKFNINIKVTKLFNKISRQIYKIFYRLQSGKCLYNYIHILQIFDMCDTLEHVAQSLSTFGKKFLH